jgi:hypothetical protein
VERVSVGAEFTFDENGINHMFVDRNGVWGRYLDQSVVRVVNEAKRLVSGPLLKSRTGTLRDSIIGEVIAEDGHLIGVVEALAPHALPLHNGARPHVIRARNAPTLVGSSGDVVFRFQVNHPGNAAYPFLDQALHAAL